MAQALARRIEKEAPARESEKIELAFRLCLGRAPAQKEKDRLTDLFRKELSALKQTPQEAAALVGQKGDVKADIIELAALTTVSRVLLNLDETITRE